MEPQWAYLSIGSNLGDRYENCRQAMADLSADGTVAIVGQSAFYESEPVDYTEQDWFLNAALKIETNLDPLSLLDKLQGIQRSFGRKEGGVRFGPRVLDLDIIFYGERIINSDRLVVPHPRAHKRRFVLQPICDIDPTVVHPLLRESAKNLLNQLNEEGQRLKLCSCDCSYI